MKKQLRPYILCATLLFGVVGLLQALPTSATTVVPLRYAESVEPGETLVTRMLIGNETAETAKYTILVQNFSLDENGQVQLQPTQNDAALWIQPASTAVDVPGQQAAELPITIQVPTDATPGGHFAAVTVSAVEAGAESAYSTLFMLSVKGNRQAKVEVTELSTPRTHYSSTEYVPLHIRIRNSGNVHFIPTGNITISRGYDPVAEIEFNQLHEIILPGGERVFDVQWGLPPSFGKYTAQLELTLDDQVIESPPASFWIFDWERMVSVAAAIVIFVIVAAVLVRRPEKA